jgi:Tfp pilus assembly ATPase PilU
MHFWIDIEFTKILGQFKQKKVVDLFMTCNFNFSLKIKLNFRKIYLLLLNKLLIIKTHYRIISF